MSETSTKPYLIRAIYEWCTDNGFTPYIAVFVDNSTNVPREFVKNDEIVLNVSFDATSQLDMGNEWISFHARFSGVSRKIEVPVDNVLAVYARENGQGMAFPVERSTPPAQAATERENSPPPKLSAVESEAVPEPATAETQGGSDDEPTPPSVPRIGGKPSLKVVK
ncbi:ClpXP protease specificity-enhancing factor [Ralstonia solanacearum species complex bacterium KE056]|uniref:ClpXP protease specificity-enhancing factor n=1 Tax=Ralstonia solanacearum species complex TaxID=3116862 RepID=UPI0001D96D81|nr:ClpXP protease specificity-enhancing factor [Ralstonia pseudosolanacearum]CBJ36680.1 stringent starvation protein B, ClpXP protease specificity-enhancing factor [Ralstonia solanacearum CMR15]